MSLPAARTGAHLLGQRAWRRVNIARVRREAEWTPEERARGHRDFGLGEREVGVHLTAAAGTLDFTRDPGGDEKQRHSPDDEHARTMGEAEQQAERARVPNWIAAKEMRVGREDRR